MRGSSRDQRSRDRPHLPGADPARHPPGARPLLPLHPRRAPVVSPGPQRRRVLPRGQEQPRPAGRPAGRPRLDPGRPRRPPRRQRDPPGRLRQPHGADEDEGQGQGRPDPALRRTGHEAAGRHEQGPRLRLPDAQALLERIPLPAHPGHHRGHHPAGPADPRAPRGVPRHHRRADRRTPLPRARRRQHRPGARLPLPGHRRRDPEGQEHQLAPAALRPGRPLRPGTHVRQDPARQVRRHPLRGRQPRPRHGPGQERPVHPRRPPRDQPRRPCPGRRRVRAERGHDRGPQADRPQHRCPVQGRRRRHRRPRVQDGPRRGHGLQPDVRPEHLGRRHLRQGLRAAHRQGVQRPADEPGDPGPGRPGLHLQGHPHRGRGQRRVRLRRELPLPELLRDRRPGLQELRVPGPRLHHPRPGPRSLLRHRVLRPRPPAVDQGRRAPPEEDPGRDLLQDRPPVRPRRRDPRGPAGRGEGPGPRPPVEAEVLGSQQGHVVQDREEGRHLRRAAVLRELPRGQPHARR